MRRIRRRHINSSKLLVFKRSINYSAVGNYNSFAASAHTGKKDDTSFPSRQWFCPKEMEWHLSTLSLSLLYVLASSHKATMMCVWSLSSDKSSLGGWHSTYPIAIKAKVNRVSTQQYFRGKCICMNAPLQCPAPPFLEVDSLTFSIHFKN